MVPIVFWFVIFFWNPLPFWAMMTPAVAILGALSVTLGGTRDLGRITLRDAALGILSAAGLYALFLLGNTLAPHIIPGATADIGSVYGIRAGTPLFLVALALLLVIGPGEVAFWQGLVEREWMGRFGTLPGWLLTSALYAAIHLWSLNPMLVLAALVAGLSWGGLYARGWSLWSLVISHAVWDVSVLVLFPIR